MPSRNRVTLQERYLSMGSWLKHTLRGQIIHAYFHYAKSTALKNFGPEGIKLIDSNVNDLSDECPKSSSNIALKTKKSGLERWGSFEDGLISPTRRI